MSRYDVKNDVGLMDKHLSTRQVYLAGPFFDESQLDQIVRVEQMLTKRGISFYSPHREMRFKRGMPRVVAQRCKHLNQVHCNKSKLVLACLSWPDTGTAWELAWAEAMGTYRLGFTSNAHVEMNLMVRETVDALVPFNALSVVLDKLRGSLVRPGYGSIRTILEGLEENFGRVTEINE